MYLRTVPRVSPVRRAIADTLKPCSCSSRITISSLNRTTPDLPRTVRGKVITRRALHRDPAPNGQPPPSHRVEVVKIQPPDLERIHPAMTPRNMAQTRVGPGASCTSGSMLTPARLSQQP